MIEADVSSEAIVSGKEFDIWVDGAIQLARTQSQISELMRLQALALTQQNHLTTLFLERFSSALLPVKPNVYVLIKPSSRKNITSAGSWDSGEKFFRTVDGRGVILTESVDYVVVDLSRSKVWDKSTLDEHRELLVAVMAELDEAGQRASENV